MSKISRTIKRTTMLPHRGRQITLIVPSKAHGNQSHGHCRRRTVGVTRTYNSWVAMRIRCNNPKHRAYKDYGGRGIAICDRWNDFNNFLADMGERPKGKTLDRFPNNDGNYEPGNCRWATRKQQSQNNRGVRLLTFNEQTLCVSDWAQTLGISPSSITRRLSDGWTVERTLTTPRIIGNPTGRRPHAVIDASRA